MTEQALSIVQVCTIITAISVLIGLIVMLIFNKKHKVDPFINVIFCSIFVFTIIGSIFSFKTAEARYEVLENSKIAYEDYGVYVDNDTGEFFKITKDSENKYCRDYLDEAEIQTIRDFKEGKLEKVENVEVLIDKNGNYVITDAVT